MKVELEIWAGTFRLPDGILWLWRIRGDAFLFPSPKDCLQCIPAAPEVSFPYRPEPTTPAGPGDLPVRRDGRDSALVRWAETSPAGTRIHTSVHARRDEVEARLPTNVGVCRRFYRIR